MEVLKNKMGERLPEVWKNKSCVDLDTIACSDITWFGVRISLHSYLFTVFVSIRCPENYVMVQVIDHEGLHNNSSNCRCKHVCKII